MQLKTFKKLKARFLSKPLHHIDTSVLIETIFKQPKARYCVQYLNLLGRRGKYRASICTPVAGEVAKGILTTFAPVDHNEIANTWIAFQELVNEKAIELYTPTKKVFEIAKEISEEYTRLGSMDALIYACAVVDKAKALVCLDKDFSEELANQYGVKIINLSKQKGKF